jgi:hypothetical protein
MPAQTTARPAMPAMFISHGSPLLAITDSAALDGEHDVRIHSSYDRGLLSLDAYAFGALGVPSSREMPGGFRISTRTA